MKNLPPSAIGTFAHKYRGKVVLVLGGNKEKENEFTR